MGSKLRLVKDNDGTWREWDEDLDGRMDGWETAGTILVAKTKADTTPESPMEVERRVAISLAVSRYLRTAEWFNKASSEFTKACRALRKQLGINARFVIRIDSESYLVSTDADGNFEVDLATKCGEGEQ